MRDNNVMIITGGRCNKLLVARLMEELDISQVIAVDGGLKTADQLKITPDYIVGDFDTIDSETINRYRQLAKGQEKPKVLSFQPEKDDTDTEIAIRLCIEMKADKVVLVGATGTRLDHTFANIHLLKMLLDAGIPAFIYDDNNKIYLIDRTLQIKKQDLYGNYFSMLPFTEKVTGITLTGFKYPLEQKTVHFGTSLCISNEVVKEHARVELNEGILIIFEARD